MCSVWIHLKLSAEKLGLQDLGPTSPAPDSKVLRKTVLSLVPDPNIFFPKRDLWFSWQYREARSAGKQKPIC